MTKPVLGSAPAPDHIMLSLNGCASTCRAITWRTCEDVQAGDVRYWVSGKPAQVLRQASETGLFVSDIDRSTMHWAQLSGLLPGTRYTYTCGDDAHRSAEFSFTTAPEKIERFKFICIADHQKGEPFEVSDYSVVNGFLKQMLREYPDCAFILTGGDNTDCGQHEQQWNAYFHSGMAGVCESMPLMMNMGNHDNRGFRESYKEGRGRYYSEPGEFWQKQFWGSYARNGPVGWACENYHFSYGNVQINVIGLTDDVRNDWLLDTVGNSSAQWKLGVWHFPVCYTGADMECNDHPPLQEGLETLDLLFAGHEHAFGRSFPMKDGALFERPSQGTIHYELPNSHRNPPPPGQTVPKVWNAAYHPHEEKLCAATIVEVEGARITLTSVLEDGRVLDQCTIDKAADQVTPRQLPPVFRSTRMIFKGMDLGLIAQDAPCECRDGVWFAPLGTLVTAIGGTVTKTPGRMHVEVYDCWAEFVEGSDVAQTDFRPMKLPAPVYRGARGQLYVPVEGCEALQMTWKVVAHNNFISFEHPSEAHPLTEQP
ncbi:MAG: metallophosphoesterase family protein [Oscillospiraceae bacterium]|nr:metallophosphoesterase family protein [Oscillospiraceae bacterium]